MSNEHPKLTIESMRKAFLDSMNEPEPKQVCLVSPAIYKRVEAAVDKGHVPPDFHGRPAAAVVLWLLSVEEPTK